MQLSDPTGAGAEPDRPSRADQTADGDQLRSAAFDHAPTAMAILDSAGRVEHANQALLDLLGCGEGQLSGLSIRALTHPEDVVSSLEDFQRLLAEPSGAVEAVTRLVGFDRQPRWVRQTMSVLPGPGVPRRRVLLQAHQVDPERRIEGGGAGRPGDELTGLAQLRAAADARAVDASSCSSTWTTSSASTPAWAGRPGTGC